MGIGPEITLEDSLVALEMIAVGERVLPAEPILLSHFLVGPKPEPLAFHPDDPPSQDRNQLHCRGAAPPRALLESALLVGLNIEEEQVGRVLPELHRELLQEVRLDTAYRQHEAKPHADGEQDDPRLVPRAAHVQDGMAEREISASRKRRDRPDQKARGEVQRNTESDERRRDISSDSE